MNINEDLLFRGLNEEQTEVLKKQIERFLELKNKKKGNSSNR